MATNQNYYSESDHSEQEYYENGPGDSLNRSIIDSTQQKKREQYLERREDINLDLTNVGTNLIIKPQINKGFPASNNNTHHQVFARTKIINH